jgi:2,3-bisphosphoglycerate-independent phosphoglycerate mutase
LDLNLMRELSVQTESKIVLLVVDGLGGLPMEPGGATELESAATPNLDRLAASSDLGLSRPVAAGVSPGSGPGHLALFGYDPFASRSAAASSRLWASASSSRGATWPRG